MVYRESEPLTQFPGLTRATPRPFANMRPFLVNGQRDYRIRKIVGIVYMAVSVAAGACFVSSLRGGAVLITGPLWLMSLVVWLYGAIKARDLRRLLLEGTRYEGEILTVGFDSVRNDSGGKKRIDVHEGNDYGDLSVKRLWVIVGYADEAGEHTCKVEVASHVAALILTPVAVLEHPKVRARVGVVGPIGRGGAPSIGFGIKQ